MKYTIFSFNSNEQIYVQIFLIQNDSIQIRCVSKNEMNSATNGTSFTIGAKPEKALLNVVLLISFPLKYSEIRDNIDRLKSLKKTPSLAIYDPSQIIPGRTKEMDCRCKVIWCNLGQWLQKVTKGQSKTTTV